MKRKLSLLLAVVMILGSFSFAFADEPMTEADAGEFLKEKGVLVGINGELKLEDNLRREDAVVMVARLHGAEEEAEAFPTEGLTFKDVTDPYYQSIISWAVANELFEGHTPEKFGYHEDISAQQYATVLLRALGYGEEVADKAGYDKALELADELGLLEGLKVVNTTPITRGQMALMTYNALGTKMKDSNETLADKLEIEMPKAPGATEVKDVRAENLKEIIVEFDGPVEKASATKITNYKLDGVPLTRASVAVLQEDESTVVIQLRAAHELKNQREYKLTISNVNSARENVVINDTKTFRPLDVKVPEVVNVDSLGNRLVRVTFSEPVTKATAEARSNYKLNGYVPNGKITLTANLRSVNIKLASPMKDGENKLSVANVEDYAGMKIVNVYDRTFEVVEDKTAPESFEVLDATLEEVVVKFNEAIDPDTAKAYNVYWLDTNGRKMTADYFGAIDYETFYIAFSSRNKLPASETTLYIEKVADFSGNTAAKLSAPVVATVDTARPELTSVDIARDWETDEYLTTLDKIDLTFNKSVDTDTMKGVNRYNVTVKNSRGSVVAVAKNAYVKHNRYFPTTVVVELSSKLAEGQTYTVEVKNVTDTTYLKNMMIPVIETLEVPNISAPQVKAAYRSNDNKKIHVVFNKEMAMGGEGSALDLNKYMIEVADSWKLLPRNTEIEPGYDNKSVIIKFEEPIIVNNIRVTLVEDAFGNKLAGLTQDKKVEEPEKTKIEKVELVAKDKVAVTFDKQLIYADPDSFRVNGKSVGVDYTVNSKGQGVVNLTLGDEIYTNKGLKVEITSAKSEDVIGLGIEEKTYEGDDIKDKVAPVVKLDNNYEPVYKDNYEEEGSDNKDYLQSVEIEYVEKLKIIDNIKPETAANDFVIYADYDNVYSQLTAGIDYVVEAEDNKVVIKFITVAEVKEVSIETADTTKYVTDMSGNSIEDVKIDIDLTAKKGIGPKKTVEDKAKADAVLEKINELPENLSENYTLENYKNDVVAARTAYDNLTEEQQKLVDDEALKKLVEAEAKVKLFGAAAKVPNEIDTVKGTAVDAEEPTDDEKITAVKGHVENIVGDEFTVEVTKVDGQDNVFNVEITKKVDGVGNFSVTIKDIKVNAFEFEATTP